MKKKYSAEYPLQVVNSSPRFILNYNIYEVSEDEMFLLWKEHQEIAGEPILDIDDFFRQEHKYAYYQVEIPMGQWTRDGIVNAIIRDKYRQDEMEAITNNMAAITGVFFETLVTEGIVSATKYLISSINTENSERFKEMQEWRKMAKEIASDIIKTPV